jgi:alpha-beta hydrolase superfamily lysophospholipase
MNSSQHMGLSERRNLSSSRALTPSKFGCRITRMTERIGIRLENGMDLAGVIHRPTGIATAGVVVCHGMLSNKDSSKHTAIAEGLAERGLCALRFDFQGRGDSPGDLMELSFTRQVDEALAALSSLRAATGLERFGLVGSSMGGAVGVLVASRSEQPLAALVTLATVGRTDRMGLRIVGEKGLAVWERKGFLRLPDEPVGWSLVEDGRRYDLPDRAAHVRCPWLILHGERDEIVPIDDARALRAAAGDTARLKVLAGADHRFADPSHKADAVARTLAFLQGELGQGADR